jgi:paraquat-inducible protein B
VTVQLDERTSTRELLPEGGDRPTSTGEMPRASIKRVRRFSPIWLVPIIAALVVVFLVYSNFVARGPLVTITFPTADGLVPGETLVRHKAVVLGKVEEVELSPGMRDVIAHVRIDRSAKAVLTENARFWVVRPRLSLNALSGLETLVSGAYIEIDPGLPGAKSRRAFKGLTEPPGVRSDEQGTMFVLESSRLRGVSPGAPVYYRDIEVGATIGAELGATEGVTMRIFLRKPYDKLVHPETRFWNASGLLINMKPEGVQIELESIQALLGGGIAFETPREFSASSPENAKFHLYENKEQANAELYLSHVACVTYLETSVAGLGRGSTVVLYGVQIGTVTDVRLAKDEIPGRVQVKVSFDIQPDRLAAPGEGVDLALTPLIHSGMRAVLDSSSLLTGQQLLSLEYVPGASSGELAKEGDAWVVPGGTGGMEALKIAAGDIAAKLRRLPIDEIGTNLNDTIKAAKRTVGGPEITKALVSLNATLNQVQTLAKHADEGLGPALARLPAISEQLQATIEKANAALGQSGYGADSDFHKSMERFMRQAGDAARTIRMLADYLDRHPEALLRGRGDPPR